MFQLLYYIQKLSVSIQEHYILNYKILRHRTSTQLATAYTLTAPGDLFSLSTNMQIKKKRQQQNTKSKALKNSIDNKKEKHNIVKKMYILQI